MGHEYYNSTIRSSSANYTANAKSAARGDYDSIFKQNKERRAASDMIPNEQTLRESRDSVNHPFSIGIIFSLDLTGSMGGIPKHLIIDGMPTMIDGIINGGFPDPQVLFLGMGDHECDHYPIQVGQFESGDAKMDEWLQKMYLEGGGGGNSGESYLIPWYFAGMHTSIDCFEKRGIKGLFFSVGDEPCLPSFNPSSIGYENTKLAPHQGKISKEDCLKLAQEKYEVYHLHCMEGSAGSRSIAGWKELLGERCIQVNDHSKIPEIIRDITVAYYKSVAPGTTPSVTFKDESTMGIGAAPEAGRKPML